MSVGMSAAENTRAQQLDITLMVLDVPQLHQLSEGLVGHHVRHSKYDTEDVVVRAKKEKKKYRWALRDGK